MDNLKNPQTPDPERDGAEEKAIATLLRFAGPRPAVAAECHERVRSAVHEKWEQSVLWRKRRNVAIWVVGSLATAAAILVSIGLGLLPGLPPFSGSGPMLANAEIVRGTVHSQRLGIIGPGTSIEVGDELWTSADDRVAIRLEDGTSLRIDTGSHLELVDESVVNLHQGAVYVDSKSTDEANAPVEIRTPLGTVTDIGTQFEVRLKNDSMRLRVREGLVDLKRGAQTYRAEAGQQLLADKNGEVIAGGMPVHGEAWAWIQEIAPTFELEGHSLQEFLDWVTRETGWRVRFEEQSIAAGAQSLILHGSIEGLRPDEVPAVVLPTCGLSHRVENGIMIIGRLPGGK
ncbi:MAG: FecR family protein [Acidobacteriota bacterium]